MIKPDQVAAVLLAGGQSRRMGQDKAFLPWGEEQQPLWFVQSRKLHQLKTAEVVLSTRPDQPITGPMVVPDSEPGLGPLSALAAVFTATIQPYLLPLAVDMPFVTLSLLRRLLADADPERGLVLQAPEHFEPFPALYPRATLLLLREHLDSGDLSMQAFIRSAVEQNLLAAAPLPATESTLFKNLNTPEDL